METREQSTSPVRCPRCGYDLRGAVAAWAESCPLQGQCAECGLAFSWAHLLCPATFEPQWCVEFAPRRRFLRAAGATFGRSFRPWRFWSAIKMSMPVRRRRLVGYALLLLLLPIAAGYVVVQAGAAVRVRHLTHASLEAGKLAVQLEARLQQLAASNPAAAAWVVQQQLAQLQARSSYSIDHSYPEAVIEALCLPWSDVSWGTMTMGGVVVPYHAPLDLYETLRLSGGPAVRSRDQETVTATAVGLALWLWALLPVSFVLLPVSRLRARVRREHLLRVMVYGLFVPMAAISAAIILVVFAIATGSQGPVRLAHMVLRYGIVLMLVVWWAAAVGRYLRMPHSAGVAVLLSVLVVLLFVAGLWLAAPDFLLWAFDPKL